MSDRGTFITDCIYCEKCLNAVREEIERNNLVTVYMDQKNDTHVSGTIKEGCPGFEIAYFREYIIPEIEKRICHTIRIAVLAESGQKMFMAVPVGGDKELVCGNCQHFDPDRMHEECKCTPTESANAEDRACLSFKRKAKSCET